MRGLHLADIHLSGKRLGVIEACFEQVSERGPYDYCIIAGDVFDQGQIGDRYASTGSLLISLMRNLDNLDCPCFILAGQHDLSPLGLSAIAPLTQAHTVTTPSEIEHKDFLLLCLPWIWPDSILAADERKDLSADELAGKYRAAVNAVLKGFAVKAAEHSGPVIFAGHLQVIGAGLPSGVALEESARNLCVTREQLLQVGADYYVLGDIHKRQPLDADNQLLGGYVGVLAQMNFGEGACIGVPDRADREGCRAGFEIVTWEGKRVKSVDFIESGAPKYHTVGCAVGKSGVPDCAGRDYVRFRDYELDPAITLEPPLVTFERIPQPTESRVRAEDVSVGKPLGDLMRQWAEAVGVDMTEGAVSLAEELAPTGEQAASMGSLERIHSIALEHIGPHENTLVELQDGLVGIAGHNGSGKTFFAEAIIACPYGEWPSRPGFYEQVSAGYEGESRIEIVFSADGKRYCARRLIKGAKSTQDTYLLEARGEGGYQPIAGPKVRDFEAATERLIGSKDLVLATIFSSQNSAGDLTEVQPRERQAVLRKLIGADRYEGIHEAAKERRMRIAAEKENRRTSLEQAEEQAAKLAELTAEYERIQGLKALAEEEVKTQEAALEDIRLRTAEVEVAQRQRARLEQEANEAAARVTRAEANLRTMQDRIAKAEASAGELERIETELKALEGVEEELAKMNALLAEERELKEQIHQAEIRLKDMASSESRLRESAAVLRKQAALVDDPELGCDSPSAEPPCKLMASAVAAKNELAAQVHELANAESAVANARSAWEQAKGEYDRREFPQIQEQVRQHEAKLKQAARLREQKAALAATLANLPTLREQVDDYAHELEHLKTQSEEKASLLADCAQPDTSQRDLLARKDTAERLLQQARASVSGHTQTLGRLEERVGQASAAGRRADELRTEIKQLEGQLADVGLVARAFGKDGVPQLLIDTALPQIQAILDDLLEGSDLKLGLSTTRDTKSGAQRETLDIIVYGPHGAREIAACSGGERKKLRIIFRLALAKFQVQRSGNRYEVLVIDEAFDALDADNRAEVIACLNRLGDSFRQVLVVTHADELIAALPSRLYFNKTNGKTTVEV